MIATEPWREPIQRVKIEVAIRPHFQRDRIWEELQTLYRQIIVPAT